MPRIIPPCIGLVRNSSIARSRALALKGIFHEIAPPTWHADIVRIGCKNIRKLSIVKNLAITYFYLVHRCFLSSPRNTKSPGYGTFANRVASHGGRHFGQA